MSQYQNSWQMFFEHDLTKNKAVWLEKGEQTTMLYMIGQKAAAT